MAAVDMVVDMVVEVLAADDGGRAGGGPAGAPARAVGAAQQVSGSKAQLLCTSARGSLYVHQERKLYGALGYIADTARHGGAQSRSRLRTVINACGAVRCLRKFG